VKKAEFKNQIVLTPKYPKYAICAEDVEQEVDGFYRRQRRETELNNKQFESLVIGEDRKTIHSQRFGLYRRGRDDIDRRHSQMPSGGKKMAIIGVDFPESVFPGANEVKSVVGAQEHRRRQSLKG